mmetsp:Transcript_59999/g.131812  ORF Transcript_59999/g.131812 Transcript_59999/m.131812 type:complete len:445 (-) Transcript_59999:82-1416(-)
MLGAVGVAAAFGGGLRLKQTFEELPLPQLRRTAETNGGSFKLSVRAVAASVPALTRPGVWSRQRPRLEVALGDVQKDTELADFAGDHVAADGGSGGVGTCARECPWRFGDTLTFIVSLKDLLGPGLRLKLRAFNDVTLGPVQFKLSRVDDLGEACVDLRRRALPGCVRGEAGRRGGGRGGGGGAEVWQSPVLLIPLSYVRGGVVGDGQGLGQAVAHVALAFSTDTDPEMILAAADAETRTVKDVIADHANNLADHASNFADQASNVMKWLGAPVGGGAFSPGGSGGSGGRGWSHGLGEPAGYYPGSSLSEAAAEEEAAERRAFGGGDVSCAIPLRGPEESPEGWVSHQGPNGRLYWHHRSMGPAPWEAAPRLPAQEEALAQRPAPQLPRSAHAASFGPIVSPDLPSEGWTCQRRADGRTFWHHTALGPAPWVAGGPESDLKYTL